MLVVALGVSRCVDPPQVWGVFGDDLFQTSAAAKRFDELLGVGLDTRLPDGRKLPGRAQLAALKTGPEKAMLTYLPGVDQLKPLDCVGTAEEARLALMLAERQCAAYSEQHKLGALPAYFRSATWQRVRAGLQQTETHGAATARILDEYNEENLMPTWLEPTARRLFSERTITSASLTV